MSEQPPSHTVTARFVVVAPDGRRSAEWRVWTGRGIKATDELYLAPRARAGELKYSLHSDNYSQLGYLDRARDRLRPGDRHAIDRWETPTSEIAPYWIAALCIWFPESELRQLDSSSLSADVVEVPSADPGLARAVMVLVGTVEASLEGLDLIAVLDRGSGGKVALVHLPIAIDSKLVPALHARDASRIPLQIPGMESREPFTWEHVPGVDGSRLVIEFAPAKRDDLPELPPFRGTVLPWAEVPQQFRDLTIVCGLLVYGRGNSSRLYVDQRSRCDHHHLGRDAQDKCDELDRGYVDRIWGRLPTGESYRIISTGRVLEDAGIDPDNPQLPVS